MVTNAELVDNFGPHKVSKIPADAIDPRVTDRDAGRVLCEVGLPHGVLEVLTIGDYRRRDPVALATLREAFPRAALPPHALDQLVIARGMGGAAYLDGADGRVCWFQGGDAQSFGLVSSSLARFVETVHRLWLHLKRLDLATLYPQPRYNDHDRMDDEPLADIRRVVNELRPVDPEGFDSPVMFWQLVVQHALRSVLYAQRAAASAARRSPPPAGFTPVSHAELVDVLGEDEVVTAPVAAIAPLVADPAARRALCEVGIPGSLLGVLIVRDFQPEESPLTLQGLLRSAELPPSYLVIGHAMEGVVCLDGTDGRMYWYSVADSLSFGLVSSSLDQFVAILHRLWLDLQDLVLTTPTHGGADGDGGDGDGGDDSGDTWEHEHARERHRLVAALWPLDPDGFDSPVRFWQRLIRLALLECVS